MRECIYIRYVEQSGLSLLAGYVDRGRSSSFSFWFYTPFSIFNRVRRVLWSLFVVGKRHYMCTCNAHTHATPASDPRARDLRSPPLAHDRKYTTLCA